MNRVGILELVLLALTLALFGGAGYLQHRAFLTGSFRYTRRKGVLLAVIAAELLFMGCILASAVAYLRQPHPIGLLWIVAIDLLLAAAFYMSARIPDWLGSLLARIARRGERRRPPPQPKEK